MSALQDELREAVRQVLREELPRVLAELRGTNGTAPAAELLDVAGAARRLGLVTSSIYKMAARCELPSVKIGRRLLFRPGDLNAYVERQSRSPERVRAIAAGAIK
jgi:excisionase family DNA binding protein